MNSAQYPKVDLTTFLLSISSAAYMGLGVIPMEQGSEPSVDLPLARHNIDLLELIAEKTKGNRTADEDRLVDQLLFETRMRFVEVQKKNRG